MNKRLAKAGRDILRDLLPKCTPAEIAKFGEIFAPGHEDFNEMIDHIPDNKIDTAISQCERTLSKEYSTNEALQEFYDSPDKSKISILNDALEYMQRYNGRTKSTCILMAMGLHKTANGNWKKS
jgi:hypothetical protein